MPSLTPAPLAPIYHLDLHLLHTVTHLHTLAQPDKAHHHFLFGRILAKQKIVRQPIKKMPHSMKTKKMLEYRTVVAMKEEQELRKHFLTIKPQ
jgi:hypothetical protein